jgi:xanthine dehydrogenase YagS FAD-binding subunit
LRVGSLARMSDLAAHPGVRQQFPVISQALELSASAQLRNMASIGSNLMQRPRRLYFRDVSASGNRHNPGSGCGAIEGYNRTMAILGTSDQCVATHPSDLAVALTAFDATVITRDRSGEHPVHIADFFRQPGNTPQSASRPTHRRGRSTSPAGNSTVGLPQSSRPSIVRVRFVLSGGPTRHRRRHSAQRSSSGRGVGTVPWRLPEVERAITGRPPSTELWRTAAELAAVGAKPLSDNGFKIGLVKRTVERQLTTVAALP